MVDQKFQFVIFQVDFMDDVMIGPQKFSAQQGVDIRPALPIAFSEGV